MLIPLRGFTPKVGADCFVAPGANIIGDVDIGDRSSIWFQVVIRGDVMPIRIGKESNIQDGSVLHGTHDRCGVQVGNRVTIGHGVVLHGCEIGDQTLVGMHSVIMDEAKIGKNCLVAAGSLVTENSEFEEGQLILGRPARAVRPLRDEELGRLSQSADNYLEYLTWYEALGESHGQP